jgi:ribosomal protein S18 acetylase RimI-like enzyme
MKVTLGIPEASRTEVATLYWEAFGAKLGRVMGPRYRALVYIGRSLQADHGLCAHDDHGRLLGVAGFKTAKGALVGGSFRDLTQVYGLIGGAIRATIMAALIRDTDNHRFLVDGIFVAPEHRGSGVGTALLDAIMDEARKRGYREVRLDVVDTNPRARALYLNYGFTVLCDYKMGLWRHVFGFRAATTMVRHV